MPEKQPYSVLDFLDAEPQKAPTSGWTIPATCSGVGEAAGEGVGTRVREWLPLSEGVAWSCVGEPKSGVGGTTYVEDPGTAPPASRWEWRSWEP